MLQQKARLMRLGDVFPVFCGSILVSLCESSGSCSWLTYSPLTSSINNQQHSNFLYCHSVNTSQMYTVQKENSLSLDIFSFSNILWKPQRCFCGKLPEDQQFLEFFRPDANNRAMFSVTQRLLLMYIWSDIELLPGDWLITYLLANSCA